MPRWRAPADAADGGDASSRMMAELYGLAIFEGAIANAFRRAVAGTDMREVRGEIDIPPLQGELGSAMAAGRSAVRKERRSRKEDQIISRAMICQLFQHQSLTPKLVARALVV